ncbi:TetR/AcrR family transcriptional regulator [Microbacterium sp. EYE_5]|uniref:TetR/AcrR family transcriptional regulator n=1 Tax=unclassified Microbacterium TaxID=2609290 RepID=UPI002003B6BC|nr:MULTISPECIES: TetR/AcrR family transcriptional regulator [unclassified Microbacterium]MCK6080151.1 TetR/AcrR family transcriptional regulator [Microbacterium sp. EYE_382]MCK6085422.1 TetR/AcrR family transcriptional regulator [Microbacterium sp. EYE_384]MCK6122353.1 TetR/AcrR family transcriptional regulator [Microbacterium sp. EYE_80]MCK6126185.1 TetR/AcrR family transcriptional regulator [Microbacterium sp. EYE_79]MCK6141106.1 TetR/AcrR family transcriptional regulator [Microbacterium sp.
MARSRENTRARLLEAAHEVFGDVGLDAASVEMICERAGFTRGAFYSNFESKDELFLALITHLAEAKLDEVSVRVKRLSGGDDPLDLVRQIADMSLAERMEPQLLSEIRTQALRDPRLAETFLAWRAQMHGRVEAIIREVTETHGLRLRMPLGDAARLLLDVSEQCTVQSALEGRSERQANADMQARLEQLVPLLVEAG